MKRIKFLFVALFAVATFAACNDDLGPEYDPIEGAPQFGSVAFKPMAVTSNDEVSVSVFVSCKYGLTAAWTVYWIEDDVKQMHVSKEFFFAKEGQVAPVSGEYKGVNVIPKHPAGTKIAFQVAAASVYGIPSFSPVTRYTVTDTDTPLPIE